MKIFYRRPLSLILCIVLGGFSLFSYFDGVLRYIFLALPLVLLPITFIKNTNLLKIQKILRVSLLAFLISCILSHCYFDLWFKAYERFEGDVRIEGTIREIRYSDYYAYLTIKTNNINSAPLSRYKILVTINLDDAEGIENNSLVSLTGTLNDFISADSDFNSNSYYISKGYSAKIEDLEYLTIKSKVSPTLDSHLSDIRIDLSSRLIEGSDEKSGGLLVALLLGERAYLSPQTKLDFKRIGISHMLALSGLHLSILVLGFSRLISLIGVGKKPRFYLIILFTILYMGITGFPVSVLRAGLMLIISSMLYLFAKAQDSLTNLCISVSIICLITPFAVFDISLWLSAFATFGIVALSDLPKDYEKNQPIPKKIFGFLKSSLIVSLFALSATFIITIFNFDEISLVSPISTLLFSPLLEIFLYLGTLMLIFGACIPLAKPIISIGSIISDFAGKLSDINFVSASSDFLFLKIASVVFSVVFFAFLVLDIKRKKLAISLISSFMCVILFSAFIAGISVKHEDKFNYICASETDTFVIIGDGVGIPNLHPLKNNGVF